MEEKQLVQQMIEFTRDSEIHNFVAKAKLAPGQLWLLHTHINKKNFFSTIMDLRNGNAQAKICLYFRLPWYNI